MMLALQVTPGLPQGVDYIRILPEIVLSLFGMLVMVLDPVMDERSSQRTLGGIALIGAVAALAATIFQAQQQYWGFAFWNMVKVDAFSVFFHFIVAAVTILVILSSYEYMEVQQIRAGEYYGLILFGAVGMGLMSSAMELVLIFIALEISSISTYILAGFRRRSAISSESSVKYFLLGSFATAFFLYGVALMFGATGSTSIVRIGDAMRQYVTGQHGPMLAYLGIALAEASQGHFRVALSNFQQITRIAPKADIGWIGSSACAEKLGMHQESLNYARRATALAPSSPGAWYQLAREEGLFGDKQAAAKALAHANQLQGKTRTTNRPR